MAENRLLKNSLFSRTIASCSLTICSLDQMKKQASIAILTTSIFWEVGAGFGFIMFMNLSFVSYFLKVMRKSTLKMVWCVLFHQKDKILVVPSIDISGYDFIYFCLVLDSKVDCPRSSVFNVWANVVLGNVHAVVGYCNTIYYKYNYKSIQFK